MKQHADPNALAKQCCHNQEQASIPHHTSDTTHYGLFIARRHAGQYKHVTLPVRWLNTIEGWVSFHELLGCLEAG